MTHMAPSTMTDLVTARPVVVCCGAGGVGKTTVSASLGVLAARSGRHACVVTVDPARRLAAALGLDSLPNSPIEVEGSWPGTLHAVMLDAKSTFDGLIERYARSPTQAETIRANRVYQNLTSALSGTQEYMAVEKLYELTTSGSYDVVIVDTPPTRHALDLLDSPRRLTQFLENRVFRALMAPTRASLKVLSVATQALLRTMSKVAGAEMVDDAVAFFHAFAGMEAGFDERAAAVRTLLLDPTTAYVVVASPRSDAIAEAQYLMEQVEERGASISSLVMNRVHPHFVDDLVSQPQAPLGSALAVLVENLMSLEALAREDEACAMLLEERAPDVPAFHVPLLAIDVHDLAGLALLADSLGHARRSEKRT